MNKQAVKRRDNSNKAAAQLNEQSNSEKAFQFEDNRPEVVAQRKLQKMAVSHSESLQTPQGYQTIHNKASKGLLKRHNSHGQHTLQRVHPAFNSVNYWKPNIIDIETGESQPHPSTPEGKKIDLTKEFGAEVMKLVLFTDLDDREAIERENLTRKYYKAKGNPWDAYRLLTKYPTDNGQLKAAYEYYNIKTNDLVIYTPEEAEDETVKHYISGFSYDTALQCYDTIKRLKDSTEGNLEAAKVVRPQLIALDIIRKNHDQKEGFYGFLDLGRTKSGTEVAFFGDKAQFKGKAAENVKAIMNTLLGAKFIQDRKPPLKIRINVKPGVDKDIANTVGNGSFITVNLNWYQLNDFSTGQLIGLLAHEIGVHSLDTTTLSKDELAAEDADKDKVVKGKHAGREFTVGKEDGADEQQYDHLTIGKGLLGQLSALPRLNMYENTVVSLINASLKETDRKEIAATYCIDMARIIVLNDNPGNVANLSFSGKVKLGLNIVKTTINEWVRMKAKYGKNNPRIQGISIGRLYIGNCLRKLNNLISKVQKEGK